MSDCSTEAMAPKEPPLTCKGCSERVLDYKCNREGGIDFEIADEPDVDGMTWADTCRWWKRSEVEDGTIELDGVTYVPKRTCHRVDSEETFGITDGGHPFDCCSLCARKLYVEDEYCSGCGAKVVDADGSQQGSARARRD